MASFAESLGNEIRSAFCGLASDLGTFYEIFTGGTIVSRLPAISAARFLTGLACNTPEPPGVGSPPFTGGQCNIVYAIVARGTYSGNAVPGGAVFNLTGFGQIKGLRLGGVTGNSRDIFVVGGNPPGSASGEQGAGVVPNSFDAESILQSVAIESVSPLFPGQPDVCGDPPPVPPPYTPGSNTSNNPVTYTNNEGNDTTVNVAIAFGYAFTDVDGSVNIPVTVNANFNVPVQINGTLNLNDNRVTYDAGDRRFPSGDGSPNVDDYQPGDDLPPNPPGLPDEFPSDPDDPEAPERVRILKGAIVTVTEVGDGLTRVFQPGGVDFWSPDLGAVYFQITVEGASGWTPPIPVKNQRSFIECPWLAGATAVRGVARNGGSFTITPVYVKVLAESVYPAPPEP